jgi:hypothetical protein
MDVRWVLRLYPRDWRVRYEDEMAALLEQRRATTVLTMLDLLLGALDTHLDPAHLTERGALETAWVRQLRLSSRSVFWALPLFIFLYGVTIFDEVDGVFDTLRETNPIVAVASKIMVSGILAALLTTLLICVLLAVGRLRAPGPLGWRVLRALPPILPPAMGAAAVSLHALAMQSWPILRGQPWDMLLFMTALLSLLSLPLVVGWAIGRDALSDREVRIVLVAASIVALGMMAHLSGLVVSQAVASAVWPGGNWSIRLVFGLAVLMLPTMLAVRSVWRGYGALRARPAA